MRTNLCRKRLIALCMAVVFALSVCAAGCSSHGDEDETTTAKKTEAETTTKKEVEEKVRPDAGTVTAYDTSTADFSLDIDITDEVHEISDLLYGIFFEDINFAADGGLYAEMIQNRSFEFTELASGNQEHAWSDVGSISSDVTIGDEEGGLNINNTNYMVLTNTSGSPAGISNKGYLDGMSINEGAGYDFSVYVKALDGYAGPVYVELKVGNDVAASGSIESVTGEWVKYELELTSSMTASSGVTLNVTIDDGSVAIDMVSLFPQDTYNNRENGLRADLVEKLAALEPSFLRFPGGCVIEGYTLEDGYDWKDSIGVDENGDPLLFNGTYGDVAARKQGQNIWTNISTTSDPWPSFMSYGLGFYEFFLLAEDIGAIGLPVLNCGMACMARGSDVAPINSEEMQSFIQDALDLVEFCKGDSSTTWGAVRIAMGHEDPFELKYIAIGNEQWGDDYFEHYEAFVDAFEEAKAENPDLYGDVELIFSAGTDDGDSGYSMYIDAYEEAEEWLEDHPDKTLNDFASAIDHHYYNSPSWFLNHANYYDEENYSRSETDFADSAYGGGIPVFLGEYAAQSNTLEAALAEAAYMTGLERNGDIVIMAAYAPLFGNLTATHWSPDLIWFNNTVSTASINYYVQKIFSINAGTTLIGTDFESLEEEDEEDSLTGMVGVGTWNTAAYFDNAKVVDNKTGDVLGEDDFSDSLIGIDWRKISDGAWTISDGILKNSSTSTNTSSYGNTGSCLYFGDTSWSDYTFTIEATKTAGDEGFLIPFAVQSSSDNFFWNIGGWGNTVSCLQQVSGGAKSDAIGVTSKSFTVVSGKTYELKVVVSGLNIKCYIDDELYVDYDASLTSSSDVYQVVSTDETGDIIVKLVNVSSTSQTIALNLQNAGSVETEAERYVVAGDSLSNDNILGAAEDVSLVTDSLTGVSGQFNYTLPKYSVTVLRIKASE